VALLTNLNSPCRVLAPFGPSILHHPLPALPRVALAAAAFNVVAVGAFAVLNIVGTSSDGGEDVSAATEEKKTRRVYERPDYLESAWWKMLEAGNCKIEGHRENKKFRRRFGVTFKRFKEICEAAKDWPILVGEEKTYGDIQESATGIPAVPLVLKILGWLRLTSKGEEE
jgi:hypothetical protein